ncbi:hypothetical protein [Nodosilinea nodulosa]|uniref:hypothetical protein n=1 Tax=Nodosilinea nodulosa TaxID=416001 RepID=UPI00030195E9|nr:hypothetical protein [Nodosilinea nodulosa]
MAPKKLTEADKTSILSLYRQPKETTSTLAERYGVSNSTISRLLKASLPEAEYSVLIQKKRGATEKTAPEKAASEKPVVVPPALSLDEAPAKAKPRRKKDADPEVAPSEPAAEVAPAEAEADAIAPAKPTRKRRSKAAEASTASDAASDTSESSPEVLPEPAQLSLPEPTAAPEKPARPVLKSSQAAAIAPPPTSNEAKAASEAAPEAADLDDDWDDDAILGDDYDDGDDSDDEDDDDEAGYAWEGSGTAQRQGADSSNLGILEISPLTAEALPPLCYVVVERTSSELVVLPLRTFADLGQIPEAEGDSRTLPVFENHNVARRFSRRNQRVVKVPDGTLLQTTSPYLQAKGITRLLIDGQVFSLGQDPVEAVAPSSDE